MTWRYSRWRAVHRDAGALLSVVVVTDNNTHNFLQETLTCAVMALVLGATLVFMLKGDWFIGVSGRSDANVPCRVMGMILSAVAAATGLQRRQGAVGTGMRILRPN
jgi:small neutral amino acid transporter SnatA (MarC family)